MFLVVLIVFIITLNLSMVMILHFTYQEELDRTREKAVGEAYFIMTSVMDNFSQLDTLASSTEKSKLEAFKIYSDYYEEREILLGLYKKGTCIAGSGANIQLTSEELEVAEGMQKVLMLEQSDHKYIVVLNQLTKPYEQYKFCYAYEISALETTSKRLVRMAIGVDFVMLLLMGSVLCIFLGKLTKPLTSLQRYAAQIASGSYGERLEIKGKDEVADLARQFNEMSLKIQEQMEALKEESEKKQRLIDNMAHEFRTPLTSISGYAQYLQMAALSEEEKAESLEYIITETKRLQKLSQTILYMADLRTEGNTKALEIEKIEVHNLLNQIKILFSGQKQYEKIALKSMTNVEFILGNQPMVEGLLINLIENGMRACKEEGQVSLSILEVDQKIQIQVKDNGIGMSKEEIQKIQEPFYRIDKARSRKMGGVGLGIALCYQIVDLHRGQIKYESELGKGTCVTIHWPNIEFTS